MNRLGIFILSLFALGAFDGRGQEKLQKWVADTVTVSFGTSGPFENSNFRLLQGIDLRPEFPSFVSVYERKKAYYFPVDQIVKLDGPLCVRLSEKFVPASPDVPVYLPTVYEFIATNYRKGRKQEFVLNATIQLQQIMPAGDTVMLGTFYFGNNVSIPKREAHAKGYEMLLDDWARRFNNDLLSAQQQLDVVMPEKLYHFRRGQAAVRKNFYTSAEVFVGRTFWGIDGELWFSHPESQQKFDRTSRMVRYQSHPNVQSISFGSKISSINYRLKPNWVVSNKTAFMLGINNWKDMETERHKFEEIFLLNASATQKISYNTLDKTGFVFGLGLMENLTYIVYHDPELKLGLVINAAYKF
jgi:hypothetical protein